MEGCLSAVRLGANFLEGWQLRQLHPGTRITHYRCFLPDLAGFASYRRGRTDGAAINFWRSTNTSRRPDLLLVCFLLLCNFEEMQSSTSRNLPETGGESGIRTRETV